MLVACNNAHQYRRGWIPEGMLIMLVNKETEEWTDKYKGGKNIKVLPDRELLRKHVDAG